MKFFPVFLVRFSQAGSKQPPTKRKHLPEAPLLHRIFHERKPQNDAMSDQFMGTLRDQLRSIRLSDTPESPHHKTESRSNAINTILHHAACLKKPWNYPPGFAESSENDTIAALSLLALQSPSPLTPSILQIAACTRSERILLSLRYLVPPYAHVILNHAKSLEACDTPKSTSIVSLEEPVVDMAFANLPLDYLHPLRPKLLQIAYLTDSEPMRDRILSVFPNPVAVLVNHARTLKDAQKSNDNLPSEEATINAIRALSFALAHDMKPLLEALWCTFPSSAIRGELSLKLRVY